MTTPEQKIATLAHFQEVMADWLIDLVEQRYKSSNLKGIERAHIEGKINMLELVLNTFHRLDILEASLPGFELAVLLTPGGDNDKQEDKEAIKEL